MADNTVLKVENLKKYFPIKAGVFSKTVGNVKAVDGVSFTIDKGETLGLVGESGCGSKGYLYQSTGFVCNMESNENNRTI